MILVAEPYIRFSRNTPRERFGELSERILADAERAASQVYGDLTTRVFVRLEQGSTKIWVSITSVVTSLVFYGSIRQSIDYLVKDSRLVSEKVLPAIRTELGFTPSTIQVSQRRTGVPGKLRKLFEQVRTGQLTPEEGTSEAIELLYRVEGPAFEALAPNLAGRVAEEMHETSLELQVVRTRKRKSREPVPSIPEAPMLFLPEPRVGVIVSRDPLSGAIKITRY